MFVKNFFMVYEPYIKSEMALGITFEDFEKRNLKMLLKRLFMNYNVTKMFTSY